MKKIDHNYWIGEYEGLDSDHVNPDLRVAMQQLYGSKGFDFGKVGNIFYDEDRKNQFRPDGYSTYTSLSTNYITRMPFRPKTVTENKELSQRCLFLAGTIAGELFFPCRRHNGDTINQARGKHREVNDMLHITLECFKKYYSGEKEQYPLKEAVERYSYFFDRFSSFNDSIEYNLLQDHIFLPKKFPTNESELVEYWERSVAFMEARNRRIEEYAIKNELFDE